MAHIVKEGLKLRANTFSRDLQLAALGDLDGLDGLVAGTGWGVLDLLNDIVALEDLAEDDVAAIEPTVHMCVSGSTSEVGFRDRRLTR